MILKKTSLIIKEKTLGDLDDSKDDITLANLIGESENKNHKVNSVHRRRDLDSLG